MHHSKQKQADYSGYRRFYELKNTTKKIQYRVASRFGQRTALAQVMRERYLEFTDDLGGRDNLGYAKRSLVERVFSWSIGLLTRSGLLPRGKSLMWADGRRPLTLYKVFSVS